jgi:hypothetical protein
MIRAFWWTGRPNFGDALAPLLLERFAGVDVTWSPPELAEVAVIGSIATMLPRQFTGTVLGIGVARDVPIDFSQATVRALRGPLTARAAGASDVALGDPGLLAPLLLEQRPPVRYALGVVPHWQDHALAGRHRGARVIDVAAPPLDVVRAIASCRRIVSSSLHGLIVADALGIPRRWETFPRVQGGGFKFADYGASLGRPIVAGRWDEADPSAVVRLTAGLIEAFDGYRAERAAA